MNDNTKEMLHKHILKQENIKEYSKIARIIYFPIKTIPYYFLMTLSHIKPFKISFKLPWGKKIKGYLPESGTFYYFGYCEANLTNFVIKNIKNGYVCLDVGAHIGYYSTLLSEIVGNNGKIYSFEPTKWTYKLLQENTKELSNVIALNFALSNSQGKTDFTDYGPGYGAYNTASKNGSSVITDIKNKYEVQTETIDNICSKYNISPDFIKLDAEGFEYNILQGATKTINESRPIISLEIADSNNWSENHDNSLNLLSELNYIPFKISKNGELEFFDKVKTSYDNIIMMPKEKIDINK